MAGFFVSGEAGPGVSEVGSRFVGGCRPEGRGDDSDDRRIGAGGAPPTLDPEDPVPHGPG